MKQFRSTHRLKGLDEAAFDKRLREMCQGIDVPDGLTEEEEADFAQELDISALEQLARKRSGAAKRTNRTESKSTSQFQRDQYISEYAKRRADGKCQLCGKDAPFKNKKRACGRSFSGFWGGNTNNQQDLRRAPKSRVEKSVI